MGIPKSEQPTLWGTTESALKREMLRPWLLAKAVIPGEIACPLCVHPWKAVPRVVLSVPRTHDSPGDFLETKSL